MSSLGRLLVCLLLGVSLGLEQFAAPSASSTPEAVETGASGSQQQNEEADELAKNNRRIAEAIVKQNMEGIPDAPCKGKATCDPEVRKKYKAIKGESPVMKAHTGVLFTKLKPEQKNVTAGELEAAEQKSQQQAQGEAMQGESGASGESGPDDLNRQRAEAIVKQNKEGWRDTRPQEFSKVLPQDPYKSDDPKDQKCTAPHKPHLRQPHYNVQGGLYPKDETKCAEGCRKIEAKELEELVKKHLPHYGSYYISICVSKKSKYSWKL